MVAATGIIGFEDVELILFNMIVNFVVSLFSAN